MNHISNIIYSLFDPERIQELTPGWTLKKEGILSWDIVTATDFEEFFYKKDDSLVAEGDPVGFDVETAKGVDLVLFDDIYWNPQYDSLELDE
jgi:hypothetical protein